MRGPALVLCLTLAGVPAARAQAPGRVDLTVVLPPDAPDPLRRALASPPDDLPVDVRLASLPTGEGARVASTRHDARLAAAREAYVNAEFDACLALLRDDAPLHGELAAGRRRTAARWLFWRTACRVGAADPSAAEDARRFAALGLEVPADVATASPEVERAIGEALDATAATPAVPLAITSTPGASVAIDGLPPGCQTPCTVQLPPGDHVIAWSAPGSVPTWRVVRAGGDSRADVVLDDASPELAARQWAAQFVGRGGHDSPASVRLLARATRARRLALLLVDREHAGARLAGVLTIDGAIAARAERLVPGALGDGAWPLLRELLVAGGAVQAAPSVVESPWFWIGIALGVGAAATVAALVAVDPGTRTTVGF